MKFPKVRQVTLHSLSSSEHGIDKNISNLDFVPSLSECNSFITVLTEMKNVMKAVHLTHIGVFGLQELQKIKRLHEYQAMQNKVSEEKAWFNKEPNSPYGISTKPDMNVVGELHSFLLQHSDGESFMKPFTIEEDVASLCCNRWVSLGLVQAFVKIMNATKSSSRALILNGFDMYTSRRMTDLLQLPPENSKLDHLLLLINVGLESRTGKSFVSDNSRKGNHWAVLDIDITNKKFLYCDSLGWPVPDDLRQMISPILRSLQELTGRRLPVPCARNPVIIRSAHVPRKVNERGQHECTNECLVNFPLQTCHEICGPIAILTAAICVLFPELWRSLKQSHLPINHPIIWFAAPSNYAQYLRKSLAEVLVKKKFINGYFGITSEAVDEVRKICTASHVKQMQPNKESPPSYDSQSINNRGILKVGGKLKKRFNLKRTYVESEENSSKKVMLGDDTANDNRIENNRMNVKSERAGGDRVNDENDNRIENNRMNVKSERAGGDRVNNENDNRMENNRMNVKSERAGGDCVNDENDNRIENNRMNVKSEKAGGDRVNNENDSHIENNRMSIKSERAGGDRANNDNDNRIENNRMNVKSERAGGDRANDENDNRIENNRMNVKSERAGGDRVNNENDSRIENNRMNVKSERAGGDRANNDNDNRIEQHRRNYGDHMYAATDSRIDEEGNQRQFVEDTMEVTEEPREPQQQHVLGHETQTKVIKFVEYLAFKCKKLFFTKKLQTVGHIYYDTKQDQSQTLFPSRAMLNATKFQILSTNN